MDQKPGMFPNCRDARAVAAVLIIGAALAGTIVAAIVWAVFFR